MKNILRNFSGLCVGLLLAAGAGRVVLADDVPPDVPVPITSGLKPLETVFQFGHVGIEYDLFHTFRFVNTSNKAIKLDTATVKCDCSTALLKDSIANPGDTIDVRLKFNTKDYFGQTWRSIVMVTNEPSSYKVYYSADVGQWPFYAKPEPIALFFLPAHQSLPLKLLNTVDYPTHLTGIVQQDSSYTVTVTKDKANKDQSIELTVTPKPGLKRGTYLSSLRLGVLSTIGPDTTYIAIPVKIVRY